MYCHQLFMGRTGDYDNAYTRQNNTIRLASHMPQNILGLGMIMGC